MQSTHVALERAPHILFYDSWNLIATNIHAGHVRHGMAVWTARHRIILASGFDAAAHQSDASPTAPAGQFI